MSSNYTPDTDDVRRMWVYEITGGAGNCEAEDNAKAQFDRWLQGVMAQALREAVGEFECHVGVGEFADQTIRDGIPWGHIEEAWQHQGAFMAWLLNRADELEQS